MYELLIIAKSGDDEALTNKVDKALKSGNASNVKVNRMGKRVLAYPIAKQTEGVYVVYNFESEPTVIAGVRDILRLEQEAVLRYLLIKTKVYRPSRKAKFQTAAVEVVEEDAKPAAKVTVKTKEVDEVAKDSKVVNVVKKETKVKKVTKKESSEK